MPSYELKDHIVICNWNDKGLPIIRELHAEIVKHKDVVDFTPTELLLDRLADRVGAGAVRSFNQLQNALDIY